MQVARQQAKQRKTPVEIESLRTESSSTYANSDGRTLQTVMYGAPVRTKRNGQWHDIDTTLVSEGGFVRPRMTKPELRLSDGGGTELLSMNGELPEADGKKGLTKVFAPVDLPAPRLSGNKAEYASVYGPGIDLVVTAIPTGFRQDIVIRQRPEKDLRFRVPIGLPAGIQYGKNASGELSVTKTAGTKAEEIAHVSTTLMLDAAADAKPEQGRVGHAVTTVDGASTLVIKPDAAFLADPGVTFPVTLSVSATDWTSSAVGNDTFVNNAEYPDGYANSGLDRILVGKSNSGSVRWRGYIRFEELPEDSPLRGGRVTNADLILWNYLSNDCGASVGSGITARRVTQRWDVSTLTWANQPTVTTTGQNTEFGAYSPDCGRGYMDYPWDLYHGVNSIVQTWADGGANYGFQLTAGNESDLTNWRRYRSKETTDPDPAHGPRLVIGYEPAVTEEIAAVFPEDVTEEPSYEEMLAHQVSSPEQESDAPLTTSEQSTVIGQQSRQAFSPGEDIAKPLPDEDWSETIPECGESALDCFPGPVPDTTPPLVHETSPDEDTEDVPSQTQVRVVFDEPVTGAALSLTDQAGSPIQGTAAMDDEGMVLTFAPSAGLPTSTYTGQVTGARDEAGNVMAAPYTWTFTVGDTTPGPTPTPTGPPGGEHTITLPLETDLWLDSNEYTDQFGDTLWAGVYGSPSTTERTYLNFDTTELAGKTITNARLNLWNIDSYGCGDGTSGIKARRITGAWDPDTLGWSSQPAATGGDEAVARDPGGCTGSPPADVEWSWAVTGIAQAWASGQPDHGLVLQSANESGTAPLYDRGFASSRALGEDPPTLTVTYVDGGATPTTPTTPGPDTTAPEVVAVSPADGAEEVPSGTQVTVTFSEPVTGVRFALVDIFTEEQVAGTTSMNPGGTVLTFTPSEPLDGVYSAEVDGARDTAGNTMAGLYSWYFLTAGWAARASSQVQPVAEDLRVRGSDTANRRTSTTAEPYLLVNVKDRLNRRSSVEVEVAHTPGSSQGKGVIWSGTVREAPAKTVTSVQVPPGKLKQGWTVRWRARPVTDGVTGRWSPWSSLRIGTSEAPPITRTPEEPSKTAAAAAPLPNRSFYKHATFEECDKPEHEGPVWSAAFYEGWTKNSFSWCIKYTHKIYYYRTVWRGLTDGWVRVTIDDATWVFTALLNTYVGKGIKKPTSEDGAPLTWPPSIPEARQIRGQLRINNVWPFSKSMSHKNASVYLRPGWTVSGGCAQISGAEINNKSITQWNADTTPTEEFTFYSDETQAHNEHLLSTCTLRPYVHIIGFHDDRPTRLRGAHRLYPPVIDCDTSRTNVMYYGGCVLVRAMPTMVVSTTAQVNGEPNKAQEFAKHIGYVFRYPDKTKPPGTNKKFPGNGANSPYGGWEPPLTRAMDPAVEASNRTVMGAACEQWWTEQQRAGKECDEYPFAKSHEGAASPKWDFSVRPITKSANTSGGARQNILWRRYRVLENDPFKVSVVHSRNVADEWYSGDDPGD
ncbi:DNRLRE domain-containing protein [Sphaerisporangium perillae]|uniref:DNRLRE domain-containing protein n=1 Tax=Sphaerisporangium perillae TaxID=2935860 RepID=UPI00200DE12F|nr:DNRLRE domain-containing protein [Sphaerisporangium perillae]